MIRIGILGYGNLGKGVEAAVYNAPDMELAAVFTRRAPETLSLQTENVPVIASSEMADYRDKIDVLINCGGSATDLPDTSPAAVQWFHVVDSFDNHANIPQHYEKVNEIAQKANKVAVISVGWDPGLFSLGRLLSNAVLPCGNSYTFWGRGVSQGHSDAIRRIEGVLDARQYTVPIEEAVCRVRAGENPTLAAGEKHTRECYVVAEEGADLSRIEREIKTMPNYFAEYKTEVHFISMEEMQREHTGIPHGGRVIHSGKTGMAQTTDQTMEFSLKLASNPEFTGSVLTAYARAAFRLSQKGEKGCKTVFDIAPALLIPIEPDELRAHML